MTSCDHPDHLQYLDTLSVHLGNRFSHFGTTEDLEDAVKAAKNHDLEEAIEYSPNDHPDRAGCLDTKGAILGTRYSVGGRFTDLEEAIEASREAIKITSHGHLEHATRLNNLCVLLGDRYAALGDVADLEEAVRVIRKAIIITSNGSPDLAVLLNTLSVRLGDRYSTQGSVADLEESVIVAKQVLKMTPVSHSNRATFLKNLSVQLGRQFETIGDMKALDESVQAARQAVELTPEERTAETLEEAMALARKVVEMTSDSHPGRAAHLNTLAVVLCTRYQQFGAIADLHEAVNASRDSVNATSGGNASWSLRLHNFSAHLYYRFSRSSDLTKGLADLGEAIDTVREAIKACHDGHPERPNLLSNLAVQLTSQFLKTGNMEDLRESIELGEEAVKMTDVGHSERAVWLFNLSRSLDHRYMSTLNIEDLEKATTAAREAVEATSVDYPGRAGLLNNLGPHLDSRFIRTALKEDKMESQRCYEEALMSTVSLPTYRIFAGRYLLTTPEILDYGQRAYEIAKTTIDLLLLSARSSLASVDKKPADFVTFTDLSSFQDERPDLVQSFHDLRRILDSPTQTDILMAADAPSGSFAADRRHWASGKMATLLSEIRTIPGHERFLLPATDTEMHLAAKQGPIVMINVSSHRCDALLVESSGTRTLSLTALSDDEISRRAQRLQSLETLEWLWDVVVEPVLKALGLDRPLPEEPLPRIWWIPTGSLSKFPFHAAGYHLESCGRTTLDKVISSYSSSIKAIIDTRQTRNKTMDVNSDNHVVLLAMNETEGQSRLKYADAEVQAVKSMCDLAGLSVKHPQPRKAETLSALQKCRVFHFAGHGSTKSNPLNSLIYLEDWQDEPLTVESLLETNLRSGAPFLAYLSACKTG
ncbi:hypothetical protein H9Q74_000593 [Fusarium xylarioides]|nr:hypothetical protein H9Q71_000628 [Fusarium xylarioides]KAG5829295.1 hypothetical protein H9Q74_000593 [Fusarium xylarioides]